MRELMIEDRIERYLLIEYPLHLGDVIRGSPRRNSCSWYEVDGGIRLQPWQLSLENTAIARMSGPERDHFAVALCWTTLLDQSMYSDSAHEYQRFREVTWFPKLVGSCLGACRSHQHPARALATIGIDRGTRLGKNNEKWMPAARRALLLDSLPTVTSIVDRLAESQSLYSMPGVFRYSLGHLDLQELAPQLPLHSDRLEGGVEIRQWSMPRICEEVFRRHSRWARGARVARPTRRPSATRPGEVSPRGVAPRADLSSGTDEV